MRRAFRHAAVLGAVAAMFLAGMIVASAAGGQPGGSGGSTGPAPGGPSGHAQPAVATTNGAPVPTFQPSPPTTVYVPIAPCRIADTNGGGGNVAAGSSRDFHVSDVTNLSSQGGLSTGCGIPSNASAVTAYVTGSGVGGTGVLRNWPTGLTSNVVTILYYPAASAYGSTEATLTLNGGKTTLSATNHATRVIINVVGYYVSQTHLIILADGTVWYGTNGHLKALVHDPNSGLYELTFDRSLDGCNVLTSSNDQRDVQAVGAWGGTMLDVSTSHEAGGVFTSADESFQLFVVC